MKNLLENLGVILENDHFIYTSGKHGSTYLNKDAVYPHTEIISSLCQKLAIKTKGLNPEIVAGPVAGGVVLSQWTAHHLSNLLGKEILSIYADKNKNGLVLKRGYEKLASGKRVLIVDDIVNTGKSLAGMIDAITNENGIIAGIAVICTRHTVVSEFRGIPLVSLLHIDMDVWDADICPLCKKGVPINKIFGAGKNSS